MSTIATRLAFLFRSMHGRCHPWLHQPHPITAILAVDLDGDVVPSAIVYERGRFLLWDAHTIMTLTGGKNVLHLCKRQAIINAVKRSCDAQKSSNLRNGR